MVDFMRVGTFAYNLAHVRRIYKEEEQIDEDSGAVTNPDTWVVMYEMGTDPRSGAGLISAQVFTGEEGKAVGFWVKNNIQDVMDIYKMAHADKAKTQGTLRSMRGESDAGD